MSTSTTTSSTAQPIPGRAALLQFRVTPSKQTNHQTAKAHIVEAAENGAQLVVLPEIWNGPYATAAFGEYAETLPSVGYSYEDTVVNENIKEEAPSAELLFRLAKEYGIYIVGGSVPERVVEFDSESESETTKLYNTCLCIDPSGTLVAKHRKVHLFDIDIPGQITFRESDTLSPGDSATWFDAGDGFGRIGIGIW